RNVHARARDFADHSQTACRCGDPPPTLEIDEALYRVRIRELRFEDLHLLELVVLPRLQPGDVGRQRVSRLVGVPLDAVEAAIHQLHTCRHLDLADLRSTHLRVARVVLTAAAVISIRIDYVPAEGLGNRGGLGAVAVAEPLTVPDVDVQ